MTRAVAPTFLKSTLIAVTPAAVKFPDHCASLNTAMWLDWPDPPVEVSRRKGSEAPPGPPPDIQRGVAPNHPMVSAGKVSVCPATIWADAETARVAEATSDMESLFMC